MTGLSSEAEILAIVRAEHGSPHKFLGPHSLYDGRTVIRVFVPGATSLEFIGEEDGLRQPFDRLHPAGFFQTAIAKDPLGNYLLSASYADGRNQQFHDPYRFGSQLGELDLHLFNEGTHRRAYEHLGAHPMTCDGVSGVRFAVWAPNARRVSIIGDFNHWNGGAHPASALSNSGIWELFIPDIGPGACYKISILPNNQQFSLEKADPYAFQSEVRPKSASIVTDLRPFSWNDSKWMQERGDRQAFDKPLSIYEVHLGSWRRSNDPLNPFLNYRELAHQLVEHVKRHGFTHIELMPIAEHPFDASWGYQIIGYFAPTSRFGSPEDFQYFVDYLHQNGIGLILDWVPGHFPKDGHGLYMFDGTHLYDHSDPRQGEHPDWGTRIFNFGRNEVRNFLLSNALFWLDKYHIDGLRVDAVASILYLDYSRNQGEWIPNRFGGNENLEAIAFLKQFNEVAHAEYPGILTIAEESTSWPMVSRPAYVGGLGFSLKWNMGWMHDTLDYFQRDPIYRRYYQGELTFALLYAFTENFVLPLSHDEVVHGKGSLISRMPGDWWQQFANLRLLLGLQMAHPGKKLLFMGAELGQWSEWSEATQLDWSLREWPMHRGISRYVADMNRLYLAEESLHQVDFDWRGFEWVDFRDEEQSIIIFTRKAKDPENWLLAVLNFTPQPRHHYRIGVPEPGDYVEIINSDAEIYGGSNVGNFGRVTAEPITSHGHDWSLRLTLPPLGMLLLKPM